MNNFLQAVRDGNLIAAKSAFNAEMSTRVADVITTMRQEVSNSVPLPEVPVTMESDNE